MTNITKKEFYEIDIRELIERAKKEGEKVSPLLILVFWHQRWYVKDGWVLVGGDAANLELVGAALQQNPPKLYWGEYETKCIKGGDIYVPIDKKSLRWDSTADPRIYPAPLGSTGEWKIVPCEVDKEYVEYLMCVGELTELEYKLPEKSEYIPHIRTAVAMLRMYYYQSVKEKQKGR